LQHHHEYHNADGATRRYDGEVLAYVTPWNKKGYRNALLFLPKIDFLVPVWFQVRQHANNRTLYVAGEHDVEQEWLAAVRGGGGATTSKTTTCNEDDDDARSTCPAAAKRPKVLPRLAVEVEPKDLGDPSTLVTDLLLPLQRAHGFDGFTLEMPLMAYAVVVQLMREMRRRGMFVVLVVPPYEVPSPESGEAQVFAQLGAAADRLSVMTYDYPDRGSVGFPNAPLGWVREVMAGLAAVDGMHGKLLLGLPCYGWRGNEAMVADNMVLWLASGAVDVDWDGAHAEHRFSDARGKTASYPTVAFYARRLEVVAQLGGVVGVALWELVSILAMRVSPRCSFLTSKPVSRRAMLQGQPMPYLLDVL
jgi:chitinase domain-containing protein 1